MGVQRTYEGLRIAPCFPPDWENASLKRHFRNADYEIHICNPKHLAAGNIHITMDGRQIAGNILPDVQDGQLHQVLVHIDEK